MSNIKPDIKVITNVYVLIRVRTRMQLYSTVIPIRSDIAIYPLSTCTRLHAYTTLADNSSQSVSQSVSRSARESYRMILSASTRICIVQLKLPVHLPGSQKFCLTLRNEALIAFKPSHILYLYIGISTDTCKYRLQEG